MVWIPNQVGDDKSVVIPHLMRNPESIYFSYTRKKNILHVQVGKNKEKGKNTGFLNS